MSDSGQKFIGKNRAPRVQIEYDVEVGNATKKMNLPFVMGVLADLSGNPEEALPGVEEREFLEFDVDNFDSRMKKMKPRATFRVDNTISGDGELSVDLTFESMDDFSPAAIARKVEPLNKLYEARNQLRDLAAKVDGKAKAEDLLGKLLGDPKLLEALAPKADGGGDTPAEGDS